jgi:hypothetical protein
MDKEENVKMCAFSLDRKCGSHCAAYAPSHGGETNCHRIEASIHQAIGLMRIAMHFADQDDAEEGPCMCPDCAAKAEEAITKLEKKGKTEEAVGGGMYR